MSERDNNSNGGSSSAKSSLLEKELHFKLNPRKIGKVGLIILIMVGIFILGRISAGSFDLTGFTVTTNENTEEPAPEVQETVEEEKEPVAEEQAEAAEEKEPVAEEQPEAVEGEPVVEQTIMSAPYGHVTIDVPTIDFEKKGELWGKIKSINFVIKNNEKEAIKSNYFKIMIEGDKDREQKIPLSASTQIISAAGRISGNAVIPENGFNYNQATTGPLSHVKLTFVLFDASEVAMASFSKEYDLS